MGENGKFYWLKLKRDFFKRHDIRVIESMPNGKDYVLFYLKLLLESVDHEGSLRFSETIPYNEDMLAVITNTNVDIVRSAMKLFVELGMMEILDEGTIYMNEVDRMIGSAANNDNANRQRRFRERQKTTALLPSYEGVTKNNESKSIEIEKELEIEKETKGFSEAVTKTTKTVISYLNKKAGTNYKASSEKTKTLVKARLQEGFTEADFYTVIDNKVEEWGKPPRAGAKDMRPFIRPVTLFGTKFEAYLNQRRVSNDGEHERIGEHLI